MPQESHKVLQTLVNSLAKLLKECTTMLIAFTRVQPFSMTEKLLDIGIKKLMLSFRGRAHELQAVQQDLN